MTRLLPVAWVLLAGCMTPQLAAEHVPQPGYRCEASLRGDSSAGAETLVHADGRPHSARVEWGANFAGSLFIDGGAIGFAYQAAEVDPANALGTLRWAFTPPARGDHRLEATIAPDSPMASRAPLATDYARDLHLAIMVPWPDLLALASSADSLTLVIRHQDGHEVMRQQIDPASFRRATAEMAQVQAEVRTMLLDYRDRCEFVEDLDPDIIVV